MALSASGTNLSVGQGSMAASRCVPRNPGLGTVSLVYRTLSKRVSTSMYMPPILARRTRNFSKRGPTQKKWKLQSVSFWMPCLLWKQMVFSICTGSLHGCLCPVRRMSGAWGMMKLWRAVYWKEWAKNSWKGLPQVSSCFTSTRKNTGTHQNISVHTWYVQVHSRM